MTTHATSARVTADSAVRSSAVPALLVRGAVGGMIAGAAFGGLNMWFAADQGMSATMPLQMIATIAQGEGALAAGTANPVIGLVLHMMLSAMFGAGLAVLVRDVRSATARGLAGLAFGAALYLMNFLVIAPIAFHVFRDANQPLELATHLVFGSIVVLATRPRER